MPQYSPTVKPDVVVVGAGAAGLLAALVERGGPRILVLEAARDAGRKILVSGGGRCNVLPMEDAPDRFVSESPPRLVRRFLDRWPLSGQRAFFEELLGGPLREEPESKKVFPQSNRAADVRDALRFASAGAGATLRVSAPVRDLARAGDGFAVRLDGDEEIRAPRVILATGGRSVLAGGADAAGYAWAAAMGHTVRPTYPALAPLTGDAPAHHALAGVSLAARVTARSEERTRHVERRLPLYAQGLERPGGARRLARRRARAARRENRGGPGLLRIRKTREGRRGRGDFCEWSRAQRARISAR